jgi:hypothetical protein
VKNVALLSLVALTLYAGIPPAAQEHHGQTKNVDAPMKHSESMSPKSSLKPAQGASVKIISPKSGQIIKGDSIALEFQMKKGKIGEHVHAYVDGEMAGMFKTQKGTLTGIKPGKHTLELRVATGDHNTELDATDKISFTTK